MKLFISGGMTFRQDSDWNYPAFYAAEERLSGLGFEVLNPARSDGGTTHKPREFYLRLALHLLLQADAVVVLPGWEQSRGACLEVLVAIELDMPVLDLETLQPATADLETVKERLQPVEVPK